MMRAHASAVFIILVYCCIAVRRCARLVFALVRSLFPPPSRGDPFWSTGKHLRQLRGGGPPPGLRASRGRCSRSPSVVLPHPPITRASFCLLLPPSLPPLFCRFFSKPRNSSRQVPPSSLSFRRSLSCARLFRFSSSRFPLSLLRSPARAPPFSVFFFCVSLFSLLHSTWSNSSPGSNLLHPVALVPNFLHSSERFSTLHLFFSIIEQRDLSHKANVRESYVLLNQTVQQYSMIVLRPVRTLRFTFRSFLSTSSRRPTLLLCLPISTFLISRPVPTCCIPSNLKRPNASVPAYFSLNYQTNKINTVSKIFAVEFSTF